MAEGVAAYVALTRDADSARAQGDLRTKGQVMADELVRRILGAADDDSREETEIPTGSESMSRVERPVRPARSVALNLVMSHEALLGASDDEARIAGFGPIPAELAREIVADALGRGEEVWLRRLYASPTTGELVAMDSRARLFPAGLRRLITLRDQVCRTPWCDAPIRHIDHVVAHDADGPTSGRNGQGLCEACNYAKQRPAGAPDLGRTAPSPPRPRPATPTPPDRRRS
jgi:hypothetical protein